MNNGPNQNYESDYMDDVDMVFQEPEPDASTPMARFSTSPVPPAAAEGETNVLVAGRQESEMSDEDEEVDQLDPSDDEDEKGGVVQPIPLSSSSGTSPPILHIPPFSTSTSTSSIPLSLPTFAPPAPAPPPPPPSTHSK